MLVSLNNLAFIEAVVCCALAFGWFCMSPAAKRELGFAPPLAAVTLPACAFLMPKLILLHGVMLLLVPLLARGSAGRVAPIYVMALMLLPAMPAYVATGGLFGWQHDLHNTLGIGALFALLTSTGRARGRLAHDLPFLCLFILFLWVGARNTTFTNYLRELGQITLAYCIPYFVVSRSVRSQEDIRLIMLGLIWGAIVISAILLLEVSRSWPLYRWLVVHYGFELSAAESIKMRAGMLRASGPFLESTSAAFYLVFCFVAAVLSRDKFKSQLHYLLCVGFLLAGLFAPQSRGAWLGVFMGFLLIELFRKRYAKLGRNVALLAAALVLFAGAAAVNERISRLAGLSGAVESVDYREKLWERGKDEVWKHPLAGRPQSELRSTMRDLVQGEHIVDFVNTYLFFALVAGLPGGLVFAGSLAGAAYSVVRVRKRLGPTPALTFVFLGLMLPLAMLAFTSFGGRSAMVTFAIMGIAAALQRFPRKELHQPVRKLRRSMVDLGSPPGRPSPSSGDKLLPQLDGR